MVCPTTPQGLQTLGLATIGQYLKLLATTEPSMAVVVSAEVLPVPVNQG